MSSPTPRLPPITLIIRFSASFSDLPLQIPSPQTTTAATLSTLVRPHLPPNLSACPLRYIYAGALLPPKAPLSSVLRLETTPRRDTGQKFYIHCSISTSAQLSPAELQAEAAAAAAATSADLQTTGAGARTDDAQAAAAASPLPSQPATPQGFDRLLTAGFSPAEVASLRSQFLAIQSHAHTPDTMPSPAQLRLLEERWLDSNNTPTDALGGSGDEGDGTLAGGPGALEDILWGNIMGFFWAVGAIVWLVREEGVWSKRRQVGVLTGVLVNVAVCVLRAGS